MASVDTTNNPNDPNNPNSPQGPQGQQPGQGTNQPATTGGAGAVTSTGASNVTGQVVGTNNPAQPFQNISSYLAANAPQSADLASQVAGGVSQASQKAQGDITKSSQDFTKSVNTGYTPEDTGLTSSVASNPIAAVATPNTIEAFQKQLNDTYTGPSDFTATPSYGNLESEISNAEGLAANTNTPQGIQSLLRTVEGPTTAGINNLDALLLNQNPANAETIKNAGSVANGLRPTLAKETTNNNALVQSAIDAATKAKTNAGTAINKTATDWKTQLNDLLSQDQKKVADYNTAVNAGRAQDTSALGAFNSYLNSVGYAPPTNALAEYLKNQPITTLPDASSVASSKDFAMQDALQKLLGENAPTVLNPADASKAGTFTGAPESIPSINTAVEQAFNDLQKGRWSTPGGRVVLNALKSNPNGGVSVDDPAFARFNTVDTTPLYNVLKGIDPNFQALGPKEGGSQNLIDWATANGII